MTRSYRKSRTTTRWWRTRWRSSPSFLYPLGWCNRVYLVSTYEHAVQSSSESRSASSAWRSLRALREARGTTLRLAISATLRVMSAMSESYLRHSQWRGVFPLSLPSVSKLGSTAQVVRIRRKRFTSLRYAASWSGLLSSLSTELKELARERAGEPEPSEVVELERERETIPTDGVGRLGQQLARRAVRIKIRHAHTRDHS